MWSWCVGLLSVGELVGQSSSGCNQGRRRRSLADAENTGDIPLGQVTDVTEHDRLTLADGKRRHRIPQFRIEVHRRDRMGSFPPQQPRLVPTAAHTAAQLIECHAVDPPAGRIHRCDPRPSRVGAAERLGHRVACRLGVATNHKQRSGHPVPLGLVQGREIDPATPHRSSKSRDHPIPLAESLDGPKGGRTMPAGTEA